jgi:hypothetical protein
MSGQQTVTAGGSLLTDTEVEGQISGQEVAKMNKEVTCKTFVRCSEIIYLRTLGVFLPNIRCQFEHRTQQSGREEEVL